MRKPLSILGWTAVSLLGAGAFAWLALSRGETVSAAWLLIAALCTYAVAYRFYSRIIAAKVFALDARRPTPSQRLEDGCDYVPTNRWIVFGHHFAAIAGPGPARRTNPGGAVRLPPRRTLDHRRRRARRRRAGFRHPRLVRSAQREIARANGEGRDWSGRRFHRARRRPGHHDRAHLRAGARGGERTAREPVGNRDDRADHSDRDAARRLPPLDSSRESTRGVGDRGSCCWYCPCTPDSGWRPGPRSPRCSRSRERRWRGGSWRTGSPPRCCRCGCCSRRAITCRRS